MDFRVFKVVWKTNDTLMVYLLLGWLDHPLGDANFNTQGQFSLHLMTPSPGVCKEIKTAAFAAAVGDFSSPF